MTTMLPHPVLRDGEVHAPFTAEEAQFEANRCLYCADAPCMQACPTHIDIPEFIKKIGSGNLTGSAKTILQENFLGGTCARVCPVEELCQGACVLNKTDRPIAIGRLQRHATDYLAEKNEFPFEKGESTGKRVLIVGSGPAGLSAAANLAQMGHDVEIWEKRELPGGLSTYGIITMREPIEVALHEVKMVAQLGVTIKTGVEMESKEQLAQATEEYDAVFLATGLGKVPELEIPGGALISDGLDFIATYKTAPETMEFPRSVVVIGAGNTAIDAATTARQMGAQATVVYRRRPEDMSAFEAEYRFAIDIGIEFQFMASPKEVIVGASGEIEGLRCTRMTITGTDENGRAQIAASEQEIDIPCEMIISAIGQEKFDGESGFGLKLNRGYFAVEDYKCSGQFDNLFAGGDAIRAVGDASTVMAVQDGKVAARKIDLYLKERG